MKRFRLEDFVNQAPPKFCRFVARKKNGRRPMTNQDIADASGLHRSTIAKISKLDNWNSTPIGTAARFQRACGINIFRVYDVKKFLKRRDMAYLKVADSKQRRMYARLLTELHDTWATKPGSLRPTVE